MAIKPVRHKSYYCFSSLEKMMNPAKGNTSLLLLSLLLVCPICTSLDTITPNQPLKDGDGQLLLSNQKTFALGFFNPGSSNHRYVGIWYNQSPNHPLCGLQIETFLSMIPLESSSSTVRETLYSTPKTKPLLFGPPMFLDRKSVV